MTNQQPLSSIVKSRCLSFFRHLASMDVNADASQVIFEPLLENWRRPPGRPRTTWMKTIQDDLSSLDLELHEAWLRIEFTRVIEGELNRNSLLLDLQQCSEKIQYYSVSELLIPSPYFGSIIAGFLWKTTGRNVHYMNTTMTVILAERSRVTTPNTQ